MELLKKFSGVLFLSLVTFVTLSSCEDDFDDDGWTESDGDCDDADGSVHPGADEVCDGVDQDCDGLFDEGEGYTLASFFADTDGDGYGYSGNSLEACVAPKGYVSNADDCDDTDPEVNPDAEEICDEIDNNCDTVIDEEVELTWYLDADEDGYGDAGFWIEACEAPDGHVSSDSDCDDGDSSIYPGVSDGCDGLDNDCDQVIDEDENCCTNAITMCGQDIGVTMRETWQVSLYEQNGYLSDASIPEMVDAILNGVYPPILADPSNWPANYAVGDELERASGGEYTWYEDVLDWPVTYHDPVGVVLHHTVTYPIDCTQDMQDIANLHIYGDGYGYGDVGYHITVCEDEAGIHIFENRFSGDIDSERDPWGTLYVVGAHSYPNTGYVGVALLGEFSEEAPTDQEMESLKATLARVMYETGLLPEVLVGHRDRNSTECPGDFLYEEIPNIQSHIQWCQSCGY